LDIRINTIFLISVLVLGLASYPSPLPNLDQDIPAFDFQQQLGNVAFADDEEEEEEENGEEENGEEENGEEENGEEENGEEEQEEEYEEEKQEEEQEEEDEKEEGTKVKIEIENGETEIKVQSNGQTSETEMESMSTDEIMDAIKTAPGYVISLIQSILDFVEGSEESKIEVKVNGYSKVKIEVEDEDSEIEFEAKKGRAKVKVETEDTKSKFHITLSSSTQTLNSLSAATGMDVPLIRSILEFVGGEEDEHIPSMGMIAESKFEKIEHKTKAKQNAEETIAGLIQKIEQLEQRLQSLLEKVESGEYFGPTLGGDKIIKSYSISFDGSASSLDDEETLVTDVTGEIFLDTLVTRTDTTKFRITGGEILVGDTFYDLVFGKARVTSSGPSGEKNSMILLSQIMDDEGNGSTLKILLESEVPLEGDYGIEPIQLEIKMPQSTIAHQWSLSASGQLSLLEG